jgi:ArsR family transcriptional regulator
VTSRRKAARLRFWLHGAAVAAPARTSYDLRMPRRSRPTRVTATQAERIARALAEPRRYEILRELGARNGAAACSTLDEASRVSPATLSHHIQELEAAGLIRIERQGRVARLILRREVLQAYLDRLARI